MKFDITKKGHFFEIGLIVGLVVVVCLEILVQDSNTLLPYCIPWMYDRVVMCLVALSLSLYKKFIRRSEIGFGEIFGEYVLKVALFLILIPSLFLIPNRYMPVKSAIETYGTVVAQSSIAVSKSPSSKRNWIKIKLKDEDIFFWYDVNKETKSLGTKCLLSVRTGFLGLRFVDKVDFIVE